MMNSKKWLLVFSTGVLLACLPIFSVVAEEETGTETEEETSVSPFLNTKTVETKDTSSLPVSKDDTPKILDDTAIRMPQTGEYLGMITRETTVYEQRGSLSIVYELGSSVKTDDGEPYMETIQPPAKLFRSELPQPGIENNSFLSGIYIQSDQPITIDPPAKIRIPLKEQQYNNPEVTAYYFNPETEQYENANAYLSDDGKGMIVPFVHDGFYGAFTSAGKLPDYSAVKEETPTEEDTRDLEVLPGKEERKFVIANQYLDIANHWAEPYIQKLSDVGIATGKSTILFGPDEPATRAEIIKMLVDKKFEREEVNKCLETYMPSEYTMVFFTDVPQTHQYAKYICMAAVHKITKGLNDGTFAPDTPVTRAEALKLLYDAIGEQLTVGENFSSPFSDVSADNWFAAPVLHAVETGVTKGFTEYTGEQIYIGADHLNKGDVSEHVKNLQRILAGLQFYAGEIDGVLDDEVRQSVLLYQLSKGIIKTPTDISAGVVGPSTIASLNADSGAITTSENTQTVFRPHQSVTRAELAKFAVMIFGLMNEADSGE